MLRLENVNVQYGEVKVLHDVSLYVEEGQIVSIVGANGAGKSTTLNTISGLLKPVSGQITFQDRRLIGTQAHDVVGLGIVQVPEGRRLFAEMSVRENLLVGASVARSKPARDQTLKRMVELFPMLGERMSQRAGTLSGGEQQMLAVARAMMASPRLLMLDEPSLGLSPLLVQEIFRVVRELNAGGLTVLLVEQNVKHSLGMSDYGYVLENGRIVLEGKGSDLLANEHTKKAYMGL